MLYPVAGSFYGYNSLRGAFSAENLGYIADVGRYYLRIMPWTVTSVISPTFAVYTSKNNIDTYEINDNIWAATSVSDNFDVKNIYVDNAADEDWFTFVADGVNKYTISYLNTSSGPIYFRDNKFRISIYAMSNGQEIPLWEKDSVSQDFCENFTLPAGTYYVGIAPTSSSTGPYRIKICPTDGVTNYQDLTYYYQVFTTVQNYSITQVSANLYEGKIDFVQLGMNIETGERFYSFIGGYTSRGTLASVEDWILGYLNGGGGYRVFGNNPIIKRYVYV